MGKANNLDKRDTLVREACFKIEEENKSYENSLPTKES